MARYLMAKKYLEEGTFALAADIFLALGGYSDSQKLYNEARYQTAEDYMAKGDYSMAYSVYTQLGDYLDSAKKAETAKLAKLWNGDWTWYSARSHGSTTGGVVRSIDIMSKTISNFAGGQSALITEISSTELTYYLSTGRSYTVTLASDSRATVSDGEKVIFILNK